MATNSPCFTSILTLFNAQVSTSSFVIAIPLAYWGINVYLENYAYRTDISWWLFALAAIIVLLISLVTLIYQVRKAIAINPATILKGQ